MSAADITVIIPTFNRVEMLRQVLPSYLQQRCVHRVLVIDDGSEDETGSYVAEVATKNPVIVYKRHAQNAGLPTAKNTGLQCTSTSLVFIGEDDLELADSHLDTLVDHMIATGADVIAGRRIWLRPGETTSQGLARADRNQQPVVNTALLEVNSHARPTTDVPVPILPATALMRTEVAREIQFDPHYRSGNCWREETDFHLSLGERGYRLVFCPHTVSFHHARPTFQARQTGSRLRADLRTLGAMYRNNRRMLEKHRAFVTEHGYLIGGSVAVTSLAYILVRAIWMFKSEAYKIWTSRRAP
jgi:glycosyltransferase involved in cell wall biosynthesis